VLKIFSFESFAEKERILSFLAGLKRIESKAEDS
jgi:hypothetical protein